MEAPINTEEVVEFNKENLSTKLKKFIEGGIDCLQVITDFDFTLTRDKVGGVKGSTSFNAIRKSPFVSEDFIKSTEEIDAKYRPYEKAIVVETKDEDDDGTVLKLTREEKDFFVEEWFYISYKRLCEEKLTKQNFKTIAETCGIFLRNGFTSLFTVKRKLEVPMLVVSGGIGDVVKACIEVNLEKSGLLLEDVKPFNIVSNLGEYEGENLSYFKVPNVHTMNKAGHVKSFIDQQRHLDEENRHHLRRNIIIMGDMVEDIEMAKLISYDNIIKIGFLNNMAADSHLYEKYQEAYDIIIHKDGNLWPIISVIELISGEKLDNKEKLTKEFLEFIENFEN